MSKTNICVVIPNWNGKELLKPCLDSVMAQKQPCEVIIVDNGSTDGSAEYLKKHFPGAKVIELDKNYGFAGGVNAGIKVAMKDGADFIALLNNDAVAEPDWLGNLLETAEKHPQVGIVTSKILRKDKKHLDSTGDFYSIWGLPFPRGRNEVDSGQYDTLTEVFAGSGGASLYRAKMLDEIGLFDEDFFAYFEDVDISFRAQLAGWRVNYEPTAVVYHAVGGTSSKLGGFSRYHSSKNFILLYTKNMPASLFWQYLPLFLLQWLRWLASGTMRGHLWSFLKGWLVAMLLMPKVLIKRRHIQKARKIPVKYIKDVLYHKRPPRPTKLEEL
jgi:hypothetical protein